MTPFTTARDVSLSIWQSAVKAAAEAAPSVRGAHREAEAIQDAAQGVTPADAAAENPMNAATAIYVATADPHDDSPEESALKAKGFGAGQQHDAALRSESELSAMYHELAEAIVSNNAMRQRLLEKQIAEHPAIGIFDWAKAVTEYLKYYEKLKGQPRYRSWQVEGNGDLDYSLIEWKLPSRGRVALIADWGTGRTEAINVLKAACSLHPDAIIHLGDIYYSGTPQECRDNFYQIVRTYAVDSHGAPIPVFTLAGNHDYYSGGAGFLGLIDMLNSDTQKQDASYFCLRSEDGGWQFLSADTGYHDHIFSLKRLLNATGPHLRDDEIEWHHHKLTDPRFDGRTVLLTHHQAFSATEKIGDPDGNDNDPINERLIAAFNDHLDKIPLWLWGHEHTMMIFGEHWNVQRGRCIGCGSVPMSSSKDPYSDPKYDVPFNREARLGTQGRWYNHGFAFIYLNGRGNPLNARYYQVVDSPNDDGYSMISIYTEDVA